jgi:hypothetical protein
MSFRARVVWNRDPADLGRAVSEYGEKLVYQALVNYLGQKAKEVEQQMRREAPWRDRTGEARRKLRAQVEVSGAQVQLILSHGAEHGVFLELSNGGRYAIVSPTTVRTGPEIMREMKGKLAAGGGAAGSWKSW